MTPFFDWLDTLPPNQATALACAAASLIVLLPGMIEGLMKWRKLPMSDYPRTDVTIENIKWDDYTAVADLRIAYTRQAWYPFGRHSDVEGGELQLVELEVQAAMLVNSSGRYSQATDKQRQAIRRQLLREEEYVGRVREALEREVAR